MDDILRCVDCKHFNNTHDPRCFAPQAAAYAELVTNWPPNAVHNFQAFEMRASTKLCSEEGRWWEPKEPKNAAA